MSQSNSSPTPTNFLDAVANFSALVVDPSASFGQVIVSCLKELGFAENKIFFSRKYNESNEIINKEKPQILITEYFVDRKLGMQLIHQQASVLPKESMRVSVLVTHNRSASAIAEAAEELVDDYILKPFSMGMMSARLRTLIQKKLNPPEYLVHIGLGKKFLDENNYQKAREEFQLALKLEKKPTLALFYEGYTNLVQNDFGIAIDSFRKGLDIQPLHYKCLIGEFDAFYEQKKYDEAYTVAPKIVDNYPLSPKRLGNLFIAAVFSKNLDDIPKYYDVFTKLDRRTQELTQVFSAALLTAGKFQIKANNLEKAVECFELGINVVGADPQYIDKVIRELLKMKSSGAHAASGIIAKFPSQDIGGKVHSALSFLVDQYLRPRHQVIEQGRKLVGQGYADKDCYVTLVRLLTDDEKVVLAEDVAAKAVKDFPDIRGELYEMIEKANAAILNKKA